MGNFNQNSNFYVNDGQIVGGYGNSASGTTKSFIGGGSGNIISGNSTHSTIVSGQGHVIGVNSDHSFIGGGSGSMTHNGQYNTILGGSGNETSSWVNTIVGGIGNTATAGGTNGIFVGTGNINLGVSSAIIAGNTNSILTISGEANSVIAGGGGNSTISENSFMGGGQGNSIAANSESSFIVGGSNNSIVGGRSGILGGDFNKITGGTDIYIIGSGITPIASNTTYVNKLNISDTPDSATGTTVSIFEGVSLIEDILVRDYDGSVKVRSLESLLSGGTLTASTPYQFTTGSTLGSIQPSDFRGVWNSGKWSTVSGGKSNKITKGGEYNFIGAGLGNNIYGASDSFIGAGSLNKILNVNNDGSSIVGGSGNKITGNYTNSSFIGGGNGNIIDEQGWGGPYSAVPNYPSLIVGGQNNLISGRGGSNNIIGGSYNIIVNTETSTIITSDVRPGGGLPELGGNPPPRLDRHRGSPAGLPKDADGKELFTLGNYIGGGQGGTGWSSLIGHGSWNEIRGGSNAIIGGFAGFIGSPKIKYSGYDFPNIYEHFGPLYTEFPIVGFESEGGLLRAKDWAASDYSFIGNGFNNHIINGTYNQIVGGSGNYTLKTFYSFIGGGYRNKIFAGYGSNIIGGGDNTIVGFIPTTATTTYTNYSSIGGGKDNKVVASNYSSIVGGSGNTISSGNYSSILGGQNNTINSHNNTHIIGSNITVISANTTYVESLNIKTVVTGNTISDILVRDTDGTVKVRESSSLLVGGFGGKYVINTAFTGGTSQMITHSLGTADIMVQLKDPSGKLIIPDIVDTYLTNSVDIEVSITGMYTVIIIG